MNIHPDFAQEFLTLSLCKEQPVDVYKMLQIYKRQYPVFMYGFRLAISSSGLYVSDIKEAGTYKLEEKQYKGVRVFKPLKSGGYSTTDVPYNSENLCLFQTKQDAEAYLEYLRRYIELCKKNSQRLAETSMDYLMNVVLP